jgi:hypothetical protein
VARNVSAYGSGAKSGDLEPQVYAGAQKAFADSGYKLRALLRATLTNEEFYRLLPQPAEALATRQVAKN